MFPNNLQSLIPFIMLKFLLKQVFYFKQNIKLIYTGKLFEPTMLLITESGIPWEVTSANLHIFATKAV